MHRRCSCSTAGPRSADLQWCTLYPALCERYSVIAFDHRGHGRGIRSEERFTLEDSADDAAAVVKVLEPGRRVIAIGYSMGGPIRCSSGAGTPRSSLASCSRRPRWRCTKRAKTASVGTCSCSSRASCDRLPAAQCWLACDLREEAFANPDLEPYVPWMLAEMRRTDPRATSRAGLGVRDFDARPFAPSIDVPAAVVITTDDHVVRPVKQRALASAVRATVFEIAADHDATMAAARPFAAITVEAVEAVRRAAAEEGSARRLA